MKIKFEEVKLTVILPIYNENIIFLKESIESIINQSMTNWNCIIILEGNSEANKKFLENIVKEDKRFTLIKPKNKLGLAESINLGLKKAKTEYIARFDSDDIMDKERLLTQFIFLEKNECFSVVGSNIFLINKDGLKTKVRKYPRSGSNLLLYFLFRCGLAHPSTMYRLKDVVASGMYKKDLSGAEDLDLWLRMIKKGYKFYNLQKPLLFYREKKFRDSNHWENVFRVRKDNLGIFNFLIEIVILFCIKILSFITKKIK